MIINAKARRWGRRANRNALSSACTFYHYYSTIFPLMQYAGRVLSRLVMRAALALVNAGDRLAGLALLLDCYAAGGNL